MGSAHPLNAPYQAFETSDGWLNLGAANQANWERMLRVIEAEHLNEDPRFTTNRLRMENRDELAKVLEGFFRTRSTAEWNARLDAAGVPAGPVLSIGQMHAHPQTLARHMVVETDHSIAGPVKGLGHPVKYHETPADMNRPAPMLGEHTREVLAEIGYGEAEIAAILKCGAAIAV